MGGQRGVWVLAICCALAFACAGCSPPGTAVDNPTVTPHIRNDMSTPVIIELRDAGFKANYEVPSFVRAVLSGGGQLSLTARVFRSDCSALGTVVLTPDVSIIFVESDGRVHVGYHDDVAYIHPTPFMTELHWPAVDRAEGCSGD